jgi:hypothetical protein
MDEDDGAVPPTTYHRAVAEQLRRREPAAWAAVAEAARGNAGDPADGPGAALQNELLRSAYRLEPASHPQVQQATERACAVLGVRVPVTLWQLEGDPHPNATLLHRPGEAVIAFSGGLLPLLTQDELTAVVGHELSHHLLWSWQDGALLVADRLLDAVAADARTPAAYLETARRWGLATELAADRGGLRACGDLRVAVAALVKTATGLPSVDPDAFLAQAAAVDPADGVRPGRSHPETVLRVGALARWASDPADGDAALAALLGSGLDLDRLDLTERDQLEELTRHTVKAMLAAPGMAGEAVLAHARLFFPDLAAAPAAADTVPVPAQASEATRRYLCYVLLDLATVDPDLEDAGLAEARTVAAAAHLADDFQQVLVAEGLAR